MRDLMAMGIQNRPEVQIPEPQGANAGAAKLWPGYGDALESARAALVQLYSQTKDAQAGLGKNGPELRHAVGLHLIGSGFIDEEKTASENGFPFTVSPNAIVEVYELGGEIKGKGTNRDVGAALHNFEKLKDSPRMLRGLNPFRLPIVFFWMDQHLWLMTDETIADWFNRKVRPTDAKLSGGIQRAAVSRAVRELGSQEIATASCQRDKR